MKKLFYTIAIFLVLGLAGFLILKSFQGIGNTEKEETTMNLQKPANPGDMLQLPQPRTKGDVSLEEALTLRRSIRSYTQEPLSLMELSQLLWSAQGITNERGFRTAPSAGATFPLEMYVVVNNVEGLDKGIYHYLPSSNELSLVRLADVSADLARAALSQSMLSEAGAVLVFGAIYERTTERYGERGERYVLNEIGHASQNVHLQAAALDLGTVVIGAYRDEETEEILQLDPNVRVLYMMPVGNM